MTLESFSIQFRGHVQLVELIARILVTKFKDDFLTFSLAKKLSMPIGSDWLTNAMAFG